MWDWITGLFGGGDDSNDSNIGSGNIVQTETPKFYAQPEYPEAEGARQNWSTTLQDWQKSGSYGAVMPNYENIYNNAKNRINQYYWGGPSSGGLIGKIRASAARRNVTDSPATDVLTQRMGAEEAGKLGDISSNLDVTKANAVEQARTNWLTSLQNLAGLKMSGTWGGTKTTDMYEPTEGMTGLVGTGVSGLGQETSDQSSMGWLDQILDQLNTPQTTQSSLTASGVNYGDYGMGSGNYNDWQNTQGWWGQ